MEEIDTELEFDELEKLIGEIPNVASGNAHTEESAPVSANTRENRRNGNLVDGNILMSKHQQAHADQILIMENALQGNQSLTFEFEELSINNMAKDLAWKSLQSPSILVENHIPQNMNQQLYNVNTNLTPWSSSNHLNNHGGVHMARLAPQNSPACRPVFEEEGNMWQFDGISPFDIPSPAMTLPQEVSNVPVPNFQFPMASNNQQIYQNAPSPICYVQAQQINHRQMGWNYVEEQPFYRMHEQYPYLQHLHNQQLKCLHPMQQHENILSRNQCQNFRQQHLEVPISHHLQQSNHDPFWRTCAYCRDPNQLNPVYSTQHRDAIEGMEKISWQSVPRKILARTHGRRAVDAMKFVSVDKSLNYVNRNGVIRPNGCVRRNNSTPTTELPFRGDLNSSALSSDSANHKSLPQKFNSLDEVTGRIYLMAKDQQGCRFLQRKFSEGNGKDIDKIFNEIIDYIVELTTDCFGNYLVQKLLDVCDEDQRLKILHRITRKHGELVRISCDQHGTRTIQKVIETLKTPQQFSLIVPSLKDGIMTLMKDTNGWHVVHHCLQYLKPCYIEFLFDAARNCCAELATDCHGCCVLQKCVSHFDGEQRNILISEIIRNALVISQNKFGNYVVQFIIKLEAPWAISGVFKQLEGNYGDLSMQKFSSNVVETCLEYAGKGQLAKIIDELINDSRFDKIMQDPYGNYAIQRALHKTEGSLRAKLVDAIRPHVSVLRMSPFGKNILTALGKTR